MLEPDLAETIEQDRAALRALILGDAEPKKAMFSRARVRPRDRARRRREGGGWKIALRHADPTTAPRAFRDITA